MDPDVLLIKLADRWHNLQDMGAMPADKAKKYMDQTVFIIRELEDKKRLGKPHKKIIKKIEQTMAHFGHKIIEV
jgi:(p)ppGpp synthase/HD superfamily hydrolase